MFCCDKKIKFYYALKKIGYQKIGFYWDFSNLNNPDNFREAKKWLTQKLERF